jgi:hypothetical protein
MRAEPFLTFEDVARRLNADVALVAELVTRGELSALELAPGVFRVAPGDLRRFINIRRADFIPVGS